MIPALVVTYFLLAGLAVFGSLWAFRLRRKYPCLFLQTFPVFVLVSFVYALMNFIGEGFAAAVFRRSPGSLGEIFLIVDLATIPLLCGIFYLFFSWIFQLLERRPSRMAKTAFWGAEILFLGLFLAVFIVRFVRGSSDWMRSIPWIFNAIIGAMLAGAVLHLLFCPSRHEGEPGRRLARRLGGVYAGTFGILGLFYLGPRLTIFGDAVAENAARAGLIFLVNFPALFYLSQNLPRIFPARPSLSSTESGLDERLHGMGVSGREKEILLLVARGMDNREIARLLFISPKTVKNHMTSLYAKTGVRNRVQLANLLNIRPDDRPPDLGT